MLQPQVLATLKNDTKDNASSIPDITNKKLIIGFWHNWPTSPGQGYKAGSFADMNLTDIPEQYNVVAVAFMKGSGIPTFTPYKGTDAEFRSQVAALNAQGRAVLISLGGADAHISLIKGQEEALAYEIIRLVETYGFDGLDIDLEQSAILAADNRTVLPAALRMVKDHYRGEGKNFIISMAPEFPYLRTGGNYEAYIKALDGYYDIIAPQFYNQGGDGLWVDEVNAWLSQNNDARKEDFLYYLTDSLTHGTRGFIKIPSNKFAIGLPTNNDAAATGYVTDPKAVLNTLKRLEAAGSPIKGLMTWSVNWDNGKDSSGKPYNWEFIKRYGEIVGEGGGEGGGGEGGGEGGGGGEQPPVQQPPSAPTGLRSPQQSETTITLQWNAASPGTTSIDWYVIYRDNKEIAKTRSLNYTDSSLTPGTEYVYSVVAVDMTGLSSPNSTSLHVMTLSDSGNQPSVPAWEVGKWYVDNDLVSYQGQIWRNVMQHTSNKFWTPDLAYSLWQPAK